MRNGSIGTDGTQRPLRPLRPLGEVAVDLVEGPIDGAVGVSRDELRGGGTAAVLVEQLLQLLTLFCRPAAAANWCDHLIREGQPLLRRLAVHALSNREDLSADEKIDWLLENVGLYELSTWHETFQALRAIYPEVSQGQRQVVIEAVLAYVSASEDDDQRERFTAHHHFQWLYWLHESDPTCELVGQALNDLREQHPDFQPSEHPDLLFHITGFEGVQPQSPWSAEELLRREANQWVTDLLQFREEDPFGPSRDGLSSAVEEAATQKFEWGLDLASALAESSHWGTELWPPLIRAWSRELDEEKHRHVLRLLSTPELYPKHARPVADLLCKLVANGGMPYAVALLSEANALATQLWDYLDQDEPLLETEDWLFRAINHSPGILTQFWLSSLSVWRRQQDPRPKSFSEPYSSVFSEIVQGEALANRLGRAILARDLTFLLTADESWTKRNLIPIFESTDDDDCRVVWDGFLYGNLSPQVASALENAFSTSVSRMSSLFPVQETPRDRFVEFYTLMAIYFVEDPLQSWIPNFFDHAAVKHRRQFAWTISSHLHDMDDARQQEWWNRWLKRYWKGRLDGVPTPLADSEVGAMLEWLPRLASIFPEAVELAIQMPTTTVERSSIIYSLKKKKLWSEYPEDTGKLLVFLGESELPSYAWYGGNEMVERILALDISEDLKRCLRELSAKLGWERKNA